MSDDEPRYDTTVSFGEGGFVRHVARPRPEYTPAGPEFSSCSWCGAVVADEDAHNAYHWQRGDQPPLLHLLPPDRLRRGDFG